MAIQQDIGNKGEEIAKTFLIQKGYEILATNWRYSRAEVDIIAKDGDNLVFVEVKTRSSAYFGPPAAFVTPKKEAFMAHAASAYIEEIEYEDEIRFDVIGVLLLENKDPEIEHYEDAFFPGWH